MYGDTVDWKCSSQMHSDVADTATGRIIDQSLGASDVFYAVHRTTLLRRQFDIVKSFSPHDLFFMEQLVAFLTAISGKCRQLDLLYIARQQDSPGSSGGEHQERFGSWFDRMLLPTWSADFTRFVDLAADELARADGVTHQAATRTIRDAYKMSVAPSLLADLLTQPTITPMMPLVLQIVGRLVRLPRQSPDPEDRPALVSAGALGLARLRSRHRDSNQARARCGRSIRPRAGFSYRRRAAFGSVTCSTRSPSTR